MTKSQKAPFNANAFAESLLSQTPEQIDASIKKLRIAQRQELADVIEAEMVGMLSVGSERIRETLEQVEAATEGRPAAAPTDPLSQLFGTLLGALAGEEPDFKSPDLSNPFNSAAERQQALEEFQRNAQMVLHVEKIKGDKLHPSAKIYVEELRAASDSDYNSLWGQVNTVLKAVERVEESKKTVRPNPFRK